MPDHTPGPWTATKPGTVWQVNSPGAHVALTVECSHANTDPALREACAEANARLIAAAPDLLIQLRETLDCLRGEHGDSSDAEFERRFPLAYAAIAKAEGREVAHAS